MSFFSKDKEEKEDTALQFTGKIERDLWLEIIKLSISAGGSVMSAKYQADSLIKELRLRSKYI